MSKDIRSYFTLIFAVILSTLILWLPFLLRITLWLGIRIDVSDFKYIYGSFDGPLYIIPAKTLYDPNLIDIPGKGLIISLPLSAGYFAAHLPLYPIFIRIFSFIGYTRSLVLVNVFFTCALVTSFYYLLKKFNLSQKPLVLSLVLLFLPRFLIIRSVGAPETLFMFMVIVSVLFFERKNYVLAGVFGGLSAMTKTPGILLFFAYLLVLTEPITYFRSFFKSTIENHHLSKSLKPIFTWNMLGLLLIPIGLFTVFIFYHYRYNDFLAYFHTNGVVPMPYLFSAFNFQQKWVGTAWLEDIVLYFGIYLLSVIFLWNSKYRSFFYFSFVFLSAAMFVQHRDLSRYMLPLWPFACIAFEKFFTSKKFLIVMLLLLPAIYMYAWDFVVYNIMPIGDWTPFL